MVAENVLFSWNVKENGEKRNENVVEKREKKCVDEKNKKKKNVDVGVRKKEKNVSNVYESFISFIHIPSLLVSFNYMSPN
jgi:hypothetical protein